MAKKAAPRRGASPQKNKPARQVPGWVWMFTGVVTGLFIAFLYQLAQIRLNPPPTTDNTAQEAAEEQPEASSNTPRFDFYSVLPEMEVIVPKSDEQDLRDTTDTETLSHRNNETYLLQVGSFRTNEDADRRRAELILQGFEASIQKAEMSNGDVWHRVMVGPFSNANAMARSQDKLVAVGIESLPIKIKQ